MKDSIATPNWEALPKSHDDGTARHLVGMRWPALVLQASDGSVVDISALGGRTIVFAYPRTGRPGVENPPGWDLIPGARGCTPQACGFRDLFAELRQTGAAHVFGLSTQASGYQREAAERLHLPFPLLSDGELKLTRALTLPSFEIQGQLEGQGPTPANQSILLKRATLVARDGVIEHVFYPVFPPDRNAQEVLEWLRINR